VAKAFSIASWNVEHFRSQGVDSRVEDVVGFLADQDPDVFALYEVEGKDVFSTLTTLMPDYTFHITEGRQVQEILVGVRHGLKAFFTQRTEFKSEVSLLRPGALVTVTVDDDSYPLLFLHTKSGTDPRGMGLRDDMLTRAVEFKRTLDRASPDADANYIFLGDFNLMGMEYAYVREVDIGADKELLKLEREAERHGLRVLDKDEQASWWGGGTIPASNLDHVVAATHLEFRRFGNAEVTVRGWPKLATESERRAWVTRFSDHGLLLLEVQKVQRS
jgi:exonuclease III